MANHPEYFEIEIVHALPHLQVLKSIVVRTGDTIEQAIYQSGLLDQFPDISLKVNKVGIFSKFATLNTVLNPNDRLEIYRSLMIDPKEVRQIRANKVKNRQKTLKNIASNGRLGKFS